MATLSSPNRIVSEYFDVLRRLVSESQESECEVVIRQNAALAVITAVTVVEVFLNLWFRVRVEEFYSDTEVMQLISELGQPRPWSIDKKLRHWPKRYLGKSISLAGGPGAEFMRVKKLRNSIVHFSSSHISMKHNNVVINGLADTSEYDALSCKDARLALLAAQGIIGEIFSLTGAAPEDVRNMLHLWVGVVNASWSSAQPK